MDPALAAAMADPTERWTVTKGSLDYGPYSLAHLVEQIQEGEVMPGSLIIDNDSGERHFAEEHPFFGPMVEQARQMMDDRRRAHAEVAHSRRARRRGVALVGMIGAGVIGLGLIAYLVVDSAGEASEETRAGISAVDTGKLEAKITFPKPTAPKKRTAGQRGGGGGSDTLALDLSEGGGTERLSNDQINAVVQRHGRKLGGCLSRGQGFANIEFIVDGPTGKVSWVKVNGQQTGGLYTCVNRALRGMTFPKVDGPRTRAEFAMEL
ncbi:hypothetical protein [Haliangium sp.]